MMDVVNWVLITGADAVLWLWALLTAALFGLGGALDVVLDPVLSPLLAMLNPVATVAGDVVYALLDLMPAWIGLTFLSVVVGVVMLIAFRYTSNQDAIGRAKDDIKANLLALKLFKDDLGVMFRCQGRLLWAILRLQRYVLAPVLLMLLPMMLGLAQMGVRYQWRPVWPGERALIRVTLADHESATTAVTLKPCTGIDTPVGPVPGGGQFVWRFTGGEPGRYTLSFSLGQTIIEKELVVGRGRKRVSAMRSTADWTTQLLHPIEPRLPEKSPATLVEVVYPPRDEGVCGSNWWIAYFFVVSMLAAIVLRPVFKVKF